MEKPEDIALFDMDGTLFDYEGALKEELEKIRNPCEPEKEFSFEDREPYLEERKKLITTSASWWENLPKFKLGWDVLKIAEELGFRIVILTQGPKTNPAAWEGKKRCINNHFGEDFDIILTRDKGLVYGKILVDDYPGYIERWLKWRKNGQVIMPANKDNENFKHPQVIRYDGTNLDEVKEALKKQLER